MVRQLKHAYLFRQGYKNYTYGFLIIEGNVLYTIERPWLNNQRNVSCIPPGTYDVTFLPRSASGKYRNVWHVHNVPGRSGILIHNGNLVAHSRGCLILGSSKGTLGGKPAVLGSRKALRALQSIVGTDPYKLTVVDKNYA